MKLKRNCFSLFAAVILFSPVVLQARDQQENVVDAARKAQAEKKAATKPAVVYSNDNLDTIKGDISVVGPAPDAPAAPASADKGKVSAPEDKAKTDASAEAPKTDASAPASAATPEKSPAEKSEADWRKDFADARRQLADDSHELDILQREYNLKTEQYYTDPNVALREQYTNDDLNKTKKDIDDKTAAVAKDKQAISDLEDALRQAGGDPGWGREP